VSRGEVVAYAFPGKNRSLKMKTAAPTAINVYPFIAAPTAINVYPFMGTFLARETAFSMTGTIAVRLSEKKCRPLTGLVTSFWYIKDSSSSLGRNLVSSRGSTPYHTTEKTSSSFTSKFVLIDYDLFIFKIKK
jgi:hypothetical protein